MNSSNPVTKCPSDCPGWPSSVLSAFLWPDIHPYIIIHLITSNIDLEAGFLHNWS